MSGSGTDKRKGKGSIRVLCGVPAAECCGGKATLAMGLQKSKAHPSSSDAFNCMKRYLLRQGYTDIGQRGFAAPDGGPVRVLTKKTRYGGRLRGGKAGRHMARSTTGGEITS